MFREGSDVDLCSEKRAAAGDYFQVDGEKRLLWLMRLMGIGH
jgi:hypothetical protein